MPITTGSGQGSGRMILERQDAEEDAPRPHNIREMGFSDNFVSKKLKGKRARNIAPTDP